MGLLTLDTFSKSLVQSMSRLLTKLHVKVLRCRDFNVYATLNILLLCFELLIFCFQNQVMKIIIKTKIDRTVC